MTLIFGLFWVEKFSLVIYTYFFCIVIFYDGNCLCMCYHTFTVINPACPPWIGYHISS